MSELYSVRCVRNCYVLLGIAVGRCTIPFAVMYQSHNRVLPLHRIQLFGETPSHVGQPRFLLVLLGVSVVAVLQNSSKNSLINTSLVNRNQATHNKSLQPMELPRANFHLLPATG